MLPQKGPPHATHTDTNTALLQVSFLGARLERAVTIMILDQNPVLNVILAFIDLLRCVCVVCR
jgi:hypothetical protein